MLHLAQFRVEDSDALVRIMTEERWPYHVRRTWTAAQVGQAIADGHFEGPSTRTLWIDADAQRLGFATISDLDESTPLLDIRIGARFRGHGHGTQAVAALTMWLFQTFPAIERFEGQTRADNLAMRKVFRRCGFVKEAHYRRGWPGDDGTPITSVGYSILRQDWVSGVPTPVDWDEPPL